MYREAMRGDVVLHGPEKVAGRLDLRSAQFCPHISRRTFKLGGEKRIGVGGGDPLLACLRWMLLGSSSGEVIVPPVRHVPTAIKLERERPGDCRRLVRSSLVGSRRPCPK